MKSVGFKADDVEMRENTEKVVAAMHDVAKVNMFLAIVSKTHISDDLSKRRLANPNVLFMSAV